MASKRERLQIHNWDGVAVLDLGDMDIWDGADLALLRETLHNQIEVQRRRSIGVSLHHVKYIPSGFFGMMFDWHERGVEISLYTPQVNVAQMLWFRQFFEPVGGGRYILCADPKHRIIPLNEVEWTNEEDFIEEEMQKIAAAGRR
jgi:hypothetical protein